MFVGGVNGGRGVGRRTWGIRKVESGELQKWRTRVLEYYLFMNILLNSMLNYCETCDFFFNK